MVKKTKVPKRAELFTMDRMDLLRLIKQLRDEIKELRLSIRAKNITVREVKMAKRKHWERIKKLRAQLEKVR